MKELNDQELHEMDNLRLVWEFLNEECYSGLPFGTYKERVVSELLKRLAPIAEEYNFEKWGWKTGKDKIIYKEELFDLEDNETNENK